MTRPQFDALCSRSGSSAPPDYIAEKIADIRDILGLDRIMLHTSVGTLSDEKVLHDIDLLGEKVAAQVR